MNWMKVLALVSCCCGFVGCKGGKDDGAANAAGNGGGGSTAGGGSSGESSESGGHGSGGNAGGGGASGSTSTPGGSGSGASAGSSAAGEGGNNPSAGGNSAGNQGASGAGNSAGDQGASGAGNSAGDQGASGTGNNAGAGPGPDENWTQTSFNFVPETCPDTGISRTVVVVFIANETNYCRWVDEKPYDTSCPPDGEEVLQLVFSAGNFGGQPVAAIGPGTYEWPAGSATVYNGDGTATCPSVTATAGSATVTSVDENSISGSYEFTIEGREVSGTFDSHVCYTGVDTRGPCAE